MSMLSSQIDKLRELAADADVYGDTRHFRDPLSDAADTIWQLRDDLQRANAAVQDAEHDESMAWDRVRKAEAENAKLCAENERLRQENQSIGVAAYELGRKSMADENAKLRELCSDMFKLAGEVYVPFEDADDWMARDGDIERRMRELGIEVNG